MSHVERTNRPAAPATDSAKLEISSFAAQFGSGLRAIAAGAAAFAASTAALEAAVPRDGAPIAARALEPRAETQMLLEKRITLDVKGLPLSDVVGAMSAMSGAKIEALWRGPREPNGLDGEMEIDLAVTDTTLVRALEKLAEKISTEEAPVTWQIREDGRLQFGVKESLNRTQELRLYPIGDLLAELPTFANAPKFDLNGALQQGRGGGSGQIIGDVGEDAPRTQRGDVAEKLKDIIAASVEPDQWNDAGGTGGSIRIYNDVFLVRAAPYIHRALSSGSR